MAQMLGFVGNVTLASGWFETNMRNDPIKLFSTTSYIIIALLGLQIFIYSNMDKLRRFKEKWFKKDLAPTSFTMPANGDTAGQRNNEKFFEGKNLILGAGSTLIVTGISVAFFVPIAVVRYIARNNLDNINIGNGRTWVYISKVTVPTCYQLVFPLFVILNNAKMRKSLLRDFKESSVWKNIFWFFSNFAGKNNHCVS